MLEYNKPIKLIGLFLYNFLQEDDLKKQQIK